MATEKHPLRFRGNRRTMRRGAWQKAQLRLLRLEPRRGGAEKAGVRRKVRREAEGWQGSARRGGTVRNELCTTCKHYEKGLREYPCRTCAIGYAVHYEPKQTARDGADAEKTK